MFSLKQRVILAALAVVGLVVVLVSPIVLHSRLNEALSDAEHARRAMQTALDSATRASTFAAQAKLQALSAVAQRDSAVTRANIADRRAATARGAFQAVAKTAPDTCAAVIAAADTLIAALDSNNKQLVLAAQYSGEAVAQLETALDTTQAALARLQGAAVPLSQAVVQLQRRSQPSFFQKLIPHAGIGAAIGFDAFGHPNTVAGVTFGWVF